ncbi:tetratricopeptide repeat protein 8 [Culicoides brevitarsis]|uniref:tetratricopeptide repeat protein 8 n=1 Tax=Culicoides brevitarsis TaxID=469753 RepID=UPI00307CA5FD
MDPFFQAISLFRRRNYDECIEICNLLLQQQQPQQQHQGRAWELKMRAMTRRVYIDEIEADDGIVVDDPLETIPATAKPGTSFGGTATAAGMRRKTAGTAGRPRTSATGRLITGVSRPGTMNARPLTSRLGNSTARLATATAAHQRLNSAQNIRLGTASMYAYGDPNGPLLHLSRFHAAQFAHKDTFNKPLFEYLYYHEGDIEKALQLCDAVINLRKLAVDWWWHAQKGRCLLALNKGKLAEEYFKQSLSQMPHPETILLLSKTYTKLKRPEDALKLLEAASTDRFPNEISLMTQQARIQEHIGNIGGSVKMYRDIVGLDPIHTEALACIAVHYFYNNQPETALLYYRRILSMGAHSAELYCNIALCCLYGGQLDLVLYCFHRSIRLATTNEQKADVWYNMSFVALTTGDINMARRCLRLCVSYDGSHGAALNNLAVLATRTGQYHKVKSYLVAAKTAAPDCEEINRNILLIEKYQ